MMRRIVIGIVCVLIGLVWFFQGLGTIEGSGMTGHGEWTVIGGILILVGGATLWGARKLRDTDRD